MSEPLLDGKRLAEELGRTPEYVTAMRRAGYRFEYEALGKTTRRHALAAIKAAEGVFTAGHYRAKGWQRLPKVLAPAGNPVASACGKSD